MSCRALILLLISPLVVWGDYEAVRVAVFQGNGVGPSSERLIAGLKQAENGRFQILLISAEEICAGKLSDVDVLVHPGGSGSKQGKALRETGRESVRKFVRDGGGFLGVCTGPYLTMNDYPCSLNFVDAKAVNRSHWARGKGAVTIHLSPTASKSFGHDGNNLEVHYGQGPLMSRREGLPHLIPLAVDWLAAAIEAEENEVAEISRIVRRHVPEDAPVASLFS